MKKPKVRSESGGQLSFWTYASPVLELVSSASKRLISLSHPAFDRYPAFMCKYRARSGEPTRFSRYVILAYMSIQKPALDPLTSFPDSNEIVARTEKERAIVEGIQGRVIRWRWNWMQLSP